MKHQPPASFRYVPFIAEVASTFNESLLSRHLIASATDRGEKLALLNERADTIRTTIYRQTLFAEFEKAAHAHQEGGGTLTAQWLNRTYGDLVRRYYGPAFTLGPDDDIEWAYIPHFYWKFYVFTYATGLSAGIALADAVSSGEPGARERYLELLKGGCSLPPLELLRRAGADLTRPDAIRAAARLLDRTLDEMEALITPFADPWSTGGLANHIENNRWFVRTYPQLILDEIDAGPVVLPDDELAPPPCFRSRFPWNNCSTPWRSP